MRDGLEGFVDILGQLKFEPPYDIEFGVVGTKGVRSSSSRPTTIPT